MNKVKSARWPQTPDGVTDWDQVFEHPKSGFIGLILGAGTTRGLKDCATTVVQHLFTRDDDAMTLMRYIIDLESLIPDQANRKYSKEEFEDVRTAVTEFLRRIKTDRTSKAKEYLAKQASSKERRLS